jgi:glycine/D-amino acid oxidase-like deaminating enzyme/nitrite reductase/ring-hydroxylating ferredoxin subunit
MNLRDGAQISLWQNTAGVYQSQSKSPDKSFDVVIIGAGITGITLALQLQQLGKKCAVLEAMDIGYGTTGGTTAHLNTLLDTPYNTIIKNFGKENAKLVASAARAGIQLVNENIKKFKIDCGYEDQTGYLFAQTEDQLKELDSIHDAIVDVGLDVSYTSTMPLPIRYRKAIEVPLQAKFHPVRYVQALAKTFEQAGGVIVTDCRVTDYQKNNANSDRQTIETAKGNFSAGALVYATHIPMGVNILHLRCVPYRSYAMAVKLVNDSSYPEGLFYDMYDPYHYYRTQEIDGQKYLIAGGEDHKTGEEPNTNGCFLHLESHIRSHFDVEEIAFKWSSQYYEPADGLPYIGHYPGHAKNVFVATGYGGNGITYSHVAALVLSGLIVGEESPYSELFSPARLKPVAGFTEFVKHNADVVKQFVGKWFGQETIETLASLAPGEGKVVKYEGQSLGLFKDEKGIIHAVNPACTHLKCSVDWNIAEQSWDCPCHGARYSCEGKVLNGPASKDLEQIEIRSLHKVEKG